MQQHWVIFLLVNLVKTSDLIGMFNSKQKCEKITSDICISNIRTVRYNTTRFPNLLDHRAQHEANLELKQFSPLVKVGCSPHLAQFLCAIYIPLCMEQYDGLIPPCQELCLKSKNGCSVIMQKFGFVWPQFFDCDNFPKQSNKSSLCIGISEENSATTSGTTHVKGEIQFFSNKLPEALHILSPPTKKTTCFISDFILSILNSFEQKAF